DHARRLPRGRWRSQGGRPDGLAPPPVVPVRTDRLRAAEPADRLRAPTRAAAPSDANRNRQPRAPVLRSRAARTAWLPRHTRPLRNPDRTVPGRAPGVRG